MAENPLTTEQVANALGIFSKAYAEALAQQMDRLGGPKRFGAYYGRPKKVVVLRAKDAYLVIFPEGGSAGKKGPAPFLQNAINILDCSGFDLNTVCQTISFRYIRIIDRAIGSHFNSPLPIPGELDLSANEIPRFTVLSETFLKDLDHAKIAAISPLWNVQQGIVRGIESARLVLWSPLVSGRRQFSFTHADFWWKPEELPLDNDHAAWMAELDATGLRFLADSGALAGPNPVLSDTNSTASELIDHRCDMFQRLLDERGDREEEIHQWFLQPGNDIFLDALAEEVRSKVPFGCHVSDFVIRRSDGTYSLCELERANARLFQKDGSPSADLNHAVQQVVDWKRYIRDNVRTVGEEQRLIGIYEPAGFVIIGRTPAQESAKSRWRDMKNRGRDGVSVYTFDDIIARTRSLARNLRRFV